MTRILWRIVCTPGHRFVADVMLDPRACWCGVFWRHYINTASRHCLHVSICVLPMVPLRLCLVLGRAHAGWPGDADRAENYG